MSVQEIFPDQGAAAVAERSVRIGAALYHPGERRLESEQETLVLEPRLADLLERLISAGGAVSRDDLLNDIWGYDGSDEALTQAISKLRRALGDERRPYRIIVTIPKFGYQLHAAAVEKTAPSASPPAFVMALGAHLSARREFYKGVAVGVGLMLAAGMAYKLMTPPSTMEREMILCPPGAPESECAAMLDRS